MKRDAFRLRSVLACLLLAACIPVDDFGVYWDKGFVDRSLQGTWKKIDIPGSEASSTIGGEELRFVRDADMYSLRAYKANESKEIQEKRFVMKSLKIKRSVFFMIRGQDLNKKGILQKYRIEKKVLNVFELNQADALEFLKSKHPHAKNIDSGSVDWNAVVIHTFDHEVYEILGEIVNDPKYWRLQTRYQKA